MTGRCREGHDSTDADYCSVCGMAMTLADPAAAASPSASAATAASSAGSDCPSCGEPRSDAAARYCEVCRFDFGAGGGVRPPVTTTALPAVASPEAALAQPAGAPAGGPAPTSPSAPARWEVLVTVDCSLDVEPDADEPCPDGAPPRTFHLDLPENLVGRRDDRRDTHPEIPLADPGVSRRHAKLLEQPDGGWVILDLGSTNGTTVNGQPLTAGVAVPVGTADTITLGRWTRMVLRGRP